MPTLPTPNVKVHNQNILLILLEKLLKKNFFIFIGIFTLRASQNCWVGWVGLDS